MGGVGQGPDRRFTPRVLRGADPSRGGARQLEVALDWEVEDIQSYPDWKAVVWFWLALQVASK